MKQFLKYQIELDGTEESLLKEDIVKKLNNTVETLVNKVDKKRGKKDEK